MTDRPVSLLPCPFCGAHAMHRTSGTAHHSVTCSDDECGVGPIVTRRFVVDAEIAWNRRAPLTRRSQ